MPLVQQKKKVREENALARREAIVSAALDQFLDKGFAAARMEDIARRAGVAKGTIYLNFNDKEALFEAIIRRELRPKVDAAAMRAESGVSLKHFVEQTLFPLMCELMNTNKGAVLRLLIGEAGRFPKLAEVYYRVIVEPGIGMMRKLARRALEKGELTDDTLFRFPQLMIAPAICGVVWKGLFERFQSLDSEQMVRAYFERMLPVRSTGSKSKLKKFDGG